jgi:hypothetical protein
VTPSNYRFNLATHPHVAQALGVTTRVRGMTDVASARGVSIAGEDQSYGVVDNLAEGLYIMRASRPHVPNCHRMVCVPGSARSRT